MTKTPDFNLILGLLTVLKGLPETRSTLEKVFHCNLDTVCTELKQYAEGVNDVVRRRDTH